MEKNASNVSVLGQVERQFLAKFGGVQQVVGGGREAEVALAEQQHERFPAVVGVGAPGRYGSVGRAVVDLRALLLPCYQQQVQVGKLGVTLADVRKFSFESFLSYSVLECVGCRLDGGLLVLEVGAAIEPGGFLALLRGESSLSAASGFLPGPRHLPVSFGFFERVPGHFVDSGFVCEEVEFSHLRLFEVAQRERIAKEYGRDADVTQVMRAEWGHLLGYESLRGVTLEAVSVGGVVVGFDRSAPLLKLRLFLCGLGQRKFAVREDAGVVAEGECYLRAFADSKHAVLRDTLGVRPSGEGVAHALRTSPLSWLRRGGLRCELRGKLYHWTLCTEKGGDGVFSLPRDAARLADLVDVPGYHVAGCEYHCYNVGTSDDYMPCRACYMGDQGLECRFRHGASLIVAEPPEDMARDLERMGVDGVSGTVVACVSCLSGQGYPDSPHSFFRRVDHTEVFGPATTMDVAVDALFDRGGMVIPGDWGEACTQVLLPPGYVYRVSGVEMRPKCYVNLFATNAYVLEVLEEHGKRNLESVIVKRISSDTWNRVFHLGLRVDNESAFKEFWSNVGWPIALVYLPGSVRGVVGNTQSLDRVVESAAYSRGRRDDRLVTAVGDTEGRVVLAVGECGTAVISHSALHAGVSLLSGLIILGHFQGCAIAPTVDRYDVEAAGVYLVTDGKGFRRLLPEV